jgi:hypothetical protein
VDGIDLAHPGARDVVAQRRHLVDDWTGPRDTVMMLFDLLTCSMITAACGAAGGHTAW